MTQNKSVEEVVEEFEKIFGKNLDLGDEPFNKLYITVHLKPMLKEWLRQTLQQERQTSQEREREIVEMIIADYMEALGTVVIPKEVWLWIADINGKYLNKNLKENI